MFPERVRTSAPARTQILLLRRSLRALGVALALLVVLPAGAQAAGYAADVGSTPGLVSWWRLGEASGTSAADAHGSVTGSWWGSVVQGVPGAIDGDADTAVSVAGNAYLSLGSSFNPTSDFSVEAWVQPASTCCTRYVLSEGSSGTGWHLFLNSSNQPEFVVHGTSSTATVVGAAISSGYWHHLVGTVAGSTATLYVDGVAVASRTFSGTPRASAYSLLAGRYAASWRYFFNGGLDELAVYDGALSAATVGAHYAEGVAAELPSTTMTGGPTGTYGYTTADFTLGSTATPATFQCSLDGAPYAGCGSAYSLTGLSQGPHSVTVRSLDRWGRADPAPLTDAWTVDFHAAPDWSPIPPATTISASVPTDTNHTDVTFNLSATKSNVTWKCSLDGKAFSACGPSQRYTGLAAGNHTFQAQATDRFGQVEPSPAKFSWTIDLTPPSTWLLAIAPGPLTGQGVAIFGSEPGAAYQCSIAGGPWSPCSSPLPIGAGQISVRAIDAAGNVDPTPAAMTLSPTPAAVPASGTAAFSTASAAFDLEVSAGGSLQCQLDGGAWQPCYFRAQYTGLGWGQHTFAVRATFAADGPPLQSPVLTWSLGSPPPRIAALQFPVLVPHGKLAVAARRPALRFSLNAAASVRVSVSRLVHRRPRVLAAWRVAGHAGSNRVVLPARLARRLRAGRYRVKAQPTGGAALSASFAVI